MSSEHHEDSPIPLNWYYRDEKCHKTGPMSFKSLQSLAAQGVITAQTAVETEDGTTAAAGNIDGITFAEPVPTNESMSWFYYDSKGKKTGPMSFTVLQSLAAQGVITRKTAVEPEGGAAAIAKSIDGLKFGKPVSANKSDAVSLLFIILFFLVLLGVIVAVTNENFVHIIYPPLPETIIENSEETAVSPVIPAPEPSVVYTTHTLELYNAIDAEMFYNDVVELVGKPTRQMKESKNITVADVPGSRTEVYRWEVNDSAGAYFEVLFQNDAVLAKNQTGLK